MPQRTTLSDRQHGRILPIILLQRACSRAHVLQSRAAIIGTRLPTTRRYLLAGHRGHEQALPDQQKTHRLKPAYLSRLAV